MQAPYLFWSVFLASFFVLWRMLSNFVSMERIGGMDVRLVILASSLVAAAGIAFTVYVVAKAAKQAQADEKHGDFGEKPKQKPPTIAQSYKWKKE